MLNDFACSAFVGVNSGYTTHGEKITDHDEAAYLIRTYLAGQGIEAAVFPARVAYLVSRGSSAGGEPCGLVALNGERAQHAVSVFTDLKNHFNQVTVGITSHDTLDNGAHPTRCFSTVRPGDTLQTVASDWQNDIMPIYEQSGLEISAGFWIADDRIQIASTINPLRVSADKWDQYQQAFQSISDKETYAAQDAFYRYLSDKDAELKNYPYTPETA